ncbi:MAG: ABC transporter ATP-binding protein [Candidatus Brocadiae bacterium]|nr:ABC transporter ATP-binding protein [Candidatus Brocadiia bacterium]
MPVTNGNVLEVMELTKTFRDFWGRESVKAIDGLNFDVRRGEVFGLLGPNGSGKTTTVRIVLGLLFPSRGAVRLFGRSPRSVDVKKRVGYMPEESHLYGYLNAEETLDFFGRLFRLPRRERRRRSDALIDMVGLRRARKRPIGQYSKGMARRIGLAQSLINDPDLLILDEPTTGLDPEGSREMKDLLLTLRDRGKTIFLCSHLLGDVEEICDRICILYGGKHRALGPVGELLAADDVTQITAPRLSESTVRKVVDLIRQTTGPESPVQVSAPTMPLEDYFLHVIEEARRERLSTAGAERGTAAAAFLGGEEEEAEQLLDELVGAAGDAEETPPAPAAEPAAAIPVQEDRHFIEELVEKSDATEPEQAARPEPAATPETGVREDVLGELLDNAGQDGKTDEDQAT